METITYRSPAPYVSVREQTRELTLLLVQAGDKFKPGFQEWMGENYHVWERFRQEADKIRACGREHYSARTIGEVLRHESALREAPAEGEPKWKLNDHVWPELARLYMALNPQAAGFFETRGRP